MKLPLLFISSVFIFTSSIMAAETSEELSTVRQQLQVEFTPRSPGLSRQLAQALQSKGSSYQPRTEHIKVDGSPIYTNRLILEDSPYLIQHAHNPVDWYPWGPEAFETAKRENKPIFLSIGYSTCHWCHVMERESFENPAISSLLNQRFIAIKVDRERRPDVDKTYMQAVMMIAGNGGWPMSSFLTIDGKPFYGGTYFPPKEFANLLLRVNHAWLNEQKEIIEHSQQISEALASQSVRLAVAGKLSNVAVNDAVNQALYRFDELQGGFGHAPKFPQEPLLFLLLSEAERKKDKDALAAIETTLDAMSQGGIYDQIGGGFHRYATDNEWLVPHFEKMLYNQAHLVRVYLRAWRLTGKPSYKRIATQTLDYVLRDMTSLEGAFYSATDADSDGEEGLFFLWTTAQIRNSLTKEDANFVIGLYGMTETGNFEQSNILHLPDSLDAVAQQQNVTSDELISRIDRIRTTLYQAREKRNHPLRDNKILTSWNGMMISALSEAGQILNNAAYTRAATKAAEFIWQHNWQSNGSLFRVHLAGSSSIAAQQEDYAYYAESLMHLYDATGDQRWLKRGQQIVDTMLKHFWDDEIGGFYMSRKESQLTGLGRPFDTGTDSSIPSGSSVALRVLQMLNARIASFDYVAHLNKLLASFAGRINQAPINYTYMLTGIRDFQQGELSATGYVARGGVRANVRQDSGHQLVIDLSIPPGWHVNSNQPLQKGLIPTTVAIDSDNSGWQLRKVQYPQAKTASLGFQDEPLSLYQGHTQIHLSVESSAKADRMLPIQLGIQACNDRICLPPEKLTLRLPMK